MNRYQISLEASRDLEEIVDYFAARNVDAGERFIREFNQKCLYLTQFPYIGRSYEDLAPQTRGIPLYNYIILYTATGTGITIVRVVSGYRDLESLLN